MNVSILTNTELWERLEELPLLPRDSFPFPDDSNSKAFHTLCLISVWRTRNHISWENTVPSSALSRQIELIQHSSSLMMIIFKVLKGGYVQILVIFTASSRKTAGRQLLWSSLRLYHFTVFQSFHCVLTARAPIIQSSSSLAKPLYLCDLCLLSLHLHPSTTQTTTSVKDHDPGWYLYPYSP